MSLKYMVSISIYFSPVEKRKTMAVDKPTENK